MRIDRARIDPNIFIISDKLRANGFSAYLVGGAVRDIAFGRQPNDFDLLTDARCADIQRIFRGVVPYGIKHGTAIVVINRKPYDVTSFNEGEPAPGSLAEDLGIRDFTINAMACDMRDMELIDPFGGFADFEAGLVRGVREARDRFAKDPLRMLRAVRFAAQFGFAVEPSTAAAIGELAPSVVTAAPERIAAELSKLFAADAGGKYFAMAVDTGLWGQVAGKFLRQEVAVPEAFAAGAPAAFTGSCSSLAVSDPRARTALAVFFTFRFAKKPAAVPDMKRLSKMLVALKFTRDDSDRIAALAAVAESEYAAARSAGAAFRPRGGDDMIAARNDMLAYYSRTKAKDITKDAYAVSAAALAMCGESAAASRFAELSAALDAVSAAGHPVFIEDLAVDGDALKNDLGMGASSLIGEMLRYAQRLVVESPAANEKPFLMRAIREKFRF